MRGLEIADGVGYRPGPFGRAPDGAEDHHRLLVVLEVAAFVAVYVIGRGHGTGASRR